MTTKKFQSLTGKTALFVHNLIQAGATLDQVTVSGAEVIVIPKEKLLEGIATLWMSTKIFTKQNLDKAIVYATQGRLAYENDHKSVKDKLPAGVKALLVGAGLSA